MNDERDRSPDAGIEAGVDGFRRAGAVSEIGEGERLVLEIEGKEIAVFNVHGEFYALLNYCVHQGGPACEGVTSGTLSVDDEWELVYDRDGEIVSCPWHGWEFEIESGENLARPKYRIPTFDVAVEDGDVFVRI